MIINPISGVSLYARPVRPILTHKETVSETGIEFKGVFERNLVRTFIVRIKLR